MFVIFLFFIFILNIKADDYVLDNLLINKYELSPTFNKYNNLYSINTSTGISVDDITYEIEEGIEVKIENLDDRIIIDLLYENNVVNTYTILVNKLLETKNVFFEPITVDENSINYKIPITIGTIVLLLLIFYVLFIILPKITYKKKKNKLFF